MPYIDVDGRKIWHEITGAGNPVVLLHGAFSGADSWYLQTPALVSAGYRVLAPERRGHARTPDVEGPLTYSIMAEDTVSYLETVLDGPADLIGWSDGAIVGFLVAQQRPDLVRKLVLIGQYFNSTGKVPGGLVEALAQPSNELITLLRSQYDPLSPDGPEHFGVVVDKTLAMFAREPEIDVSTLAEFAVPTLVLQGDRDEVTLDHSVEIVRSMATARLAVLPGTHFLLMENPDAVNALLIAFLAGAPYAVPWQ